MPRRGRRTLSVPLSDEMADLLDELVRQREEDDPSGKSWSKADFVRYAVFGIYGRAKGFEEPKPMKSPRFTAYREAKPESVSRSERRRRQKQRDRERKRSEEAREAELEAKTRTRMMDNAGEAPPMATRRTVPVVDQSREEPVRDPSYYETYTSSRGLF